MSFVDTQFDCSEEDGGVTLTFALDQPVPFNGTSVNIRSIDDSLTGKLLCCNDVIMHMHIYSYIHAYIYANGSHDNVHLCLQGYTS